MQERNLTSFDAPSISSKARAADMGSTRSPMSRVAEMRITSNEPFEQIAQQIEELIEPAPAHRRVRGTSAK